MYVLSIISSLHFTLIFSVTTIIRTIDMSEATKRKHVFQELQDPDFSITPDQKIAKVLASKGNNLHEVRD
jgi:hypothetical protein